MILGITREKITLADNISGRLEVSNYCAVAELHLRAAMGFSGGNALSRRQPTRRRTSNTPGGRPKSSPHSTSIWVGK